LKSLLPIVTVIESVGKSLFDAMREAVG